MANVRWVECSCACCLSTREAVEALIAERDTLKRERDELKQALYATAIRVAERTDERNEERAEKAATRRGLMEEISRADMLEAALAVARRERNEATTELEAKGHVAIALAQAISERDEALALFQAAQSERVAVADQHEAELDRLERERDEVRAESERRLEQCLKWRSNVESFQRERNEAELRLTESTAAFRQIQRERDEALALLREALPLLSWARDVPRKEQRAEDLIARIEAVAKGKR